MLEKKEIITKKQLQTLSILLKIYDLRSCGQLYCKDCPLGRKECNKLQVRSDQK